MSQKLKPTQWDEFDRAAFEADCEPLGFDLTRNPCVFGPEPWEEYMSDTTGYRWGGWIAGRAAIAPQPVAQAGWKLERLSESEIRITSPDCEAWRLQEADKHDGFTGFMWKLASAIAASPSAAAREPLFEVRIAGPDDVHRHSDELAALRHANEVNKQYVNDCLAHPDPMDHVLCVATVHGITKGGEQ